MRYIFNFPDIGEGLEEGKIIEWYVEKGQEIKSGDSLVKMETDKVVTDIPSPKDGVVAMKYGSPGEVVKVGNPLVELDIEGISGEEAQKTAQEQPEGPKEEQVEEKGFGVVGTLEVAGDGGYLPSSDEGVQQQQVEKPVRKKALATPVARAMAKDLGVDINLVKGSGPAGRVMKKDIQHYISNVQKSAPAVQQAVEQEPRVVYEPLSQIRKTIAKKMIRSKHNAAHMAVHEDVEVSRLMEIRKKYKGSFADENVRLSYLPFILKSVAKALKNHPSLNSQMDEENDRMIYKKYYNIGIAVDTEDGLLVPVIKDVDKKSIFELAKELTEISEKARERKLTFEDMKDGTFTITNYGSIGGLYAVPVINYPQAAIFGVGRIVEKPVVKNHEIAVGNVMPISMSVDHRIVDGGEVGRFVTEVMSYLEDPVALIMK